MKTPQGADPARDLEPLMREGKDPSVHDTADPFRMLAHLRAAQDLRDRARGRAVRAA
jgi:hypothetical protein